MESNKATNHPEQDNGEDQKSFSIVVVNGESTTASLECKSTLEIESEKDPNEFEYLPLGYDSPVEFDNLPLGYDSEEDRHSPTPAAELVTAANPAPPPPPSTQSPAPLTERHYPVTPATAETRERFAHCGVCLDGLPDELLWPCRHIICPRCAVQIDTCPICRSHIHWSRQLFF